jgi:lipopolysaccharide export system protein LptA
MRYRESARYARWAAAAALLLTVVVAGIYFRRTRRQARAERNAPPPVAATVAQQSAEFIYSKVEQDRKLFTLRASRATEFRGSDHSELDDVTVTVFGRDGTRNDRIQARACDYASTSGHVACQGPAQIDLESAQDARESPGRRAVHVDTSNVTFERETGVATTPAPATFRFPGGLGSSKGMTYNSQDGVVVLDHEVELHLRADTRPGDSVTVIRGSHLEFRRSESLVGLDGPVSGQRGGNSLTCGEMRLLVDANMRARNMQATGAPELRSVEPGGVSSLLDAKQMSADFSYGGGSNGTGGEGGRAMISRFEATGDVRGKRQAPVEIDDYAADQLDVAMNDKPSEPNDPRELTATGHVEFHSQQGPALRTLRTAALQLDFAPATKAAQRHLESGRTLAPGVVETTAPGEKTTLAAQSFTAAFNTRGQMELLQGLGGIKMDRIEGQSQPEQLTAREMDIHYAGTGDWSELDSGGDVRFRQADHSAEAQTAHMLRATNAIELQGSPAVADANSRTTATRIDMNQTTGDVTATGRVFTVDNSARQQLGPGLGEGVAQISADHLEGNSQKGIGLYTGNARIWQGDAMVQADEIRLTRDPQEVDATGNVMTLLPQQQATGENKSAKPTVWAIRGSHLTYMAADGHAHLETGVTAESDQGRMQSRILDAYLTPDTDGRRVMDHAVARGKVIVEQPGRRGTAERADYIAAEQKYVLSGGQPRLVDATRGTTTGHSLTYYVANDTILVDARGGSRTLTDHRIEK